MILNLNKYKNLGTCPKGYEQVSNQCLCIEQGDYAHSFDKIKSVINENSCRKESQRRPNVQYYEFNEELNECNLWTLNLVTQYDPFMWPTQTQLCPKPEGKFCIN